MKREKSCGAVIYKIEDSQIMFLIIKHIGGHWSYPKGHVENDETELETAKREVKEETNLDIIFEDDFRKVNTYTPHPKTIKDSVYYLATPINKDIKIQEEELADAAWLDYYQAYDTLSYATDKDILQEARRYITTKKGFK